jgi:predicted alpha-1,6-mannanase (GH76 family)
VERDSAVLQRLLTFFTARTGKWSTPTGEAWQPALAIEAVVNTYQRTRDPGLNDVMEKSFARYRGRRSSFYDDDGWYLNAWLRAYEVTGDERYLEEVRSLFVRMSGAWDDTCGGGLWWSRQRRYKNAITNGLFLLAATRLYRLAPGDPGEGGYRWWALRAWRWFDATGMINDDGLVNDGLNDECVNNGGVTWTYNQGVIVSALVELFRITGERAYLTRAHRIAGAAIATHVYPDGILREPGEPECGADAQVFKGVFVRGLAELYRVDRRNAGAYRLFLDANARTAWQVARDRSDGFGLSWRGPVGGVTAATQTAAALLFGAMAMLDAPEDGPVDRS